MIAFDTAAISPDPNTFTLSYTCTGSNLVMVVFVKDPFQGTLAYNGVSLTRLGAWSSKDTAIFYLIGPATGTHNLVLTTGGSNARFVVATYTGVKQSGFPDSSASATSASDSTLNTTVVAANCWIVGMGTAISPADDSMTISRTTRQHGFVTTAGGNKGSIILGDSNGTVATGPQGFDFNDGTLNPNNESQFVVSLEPFVEPAPAIVGSTTSIPEYDFRIKDQVIAY